MWNNTYCWDVSRGFNVYCNLSYLDFNACHFVQCIQFVFVIVTDRNVGRSCEMRLFAIARGHLWDSHLSLLEPSKGKQLIFKKALHFPSSLLVYGKMDMLKKMTLSFLWQKRRMHFLRVFHKVHGLKRDKSHRVEEKKKCICKKKCQSCTIFPPWKLLFFLSKKKFKSSNSIFWG